MKITDEMKEFKDKHKEVIESRKDKEEAINYLKLLETLLNEFKSKRPDLVKFYENMLCDAAAYFICKPQVFKDYLDDIDYQYNADNHLISYKDIITKKDELPFLNETCITLNNHYIMTLLILSFYIDPKIYSSCKENEATDLFDRHFLEKFIECIENYGISELPLKNQYHDYVHESGIVKSLLETYFPDDGISIYKLVRKFFMLKDFKRSKEIYIKVMRGIKGNSEDWKTDLFSSLDKKLLDDEEFLFDVAKKACNNWGIPFGYASKRIKNNKLFALKACNISGSNLSDFNTKFYSDRDVVLVAVASYPDSYGWIDDVLKKDKLIYDLSLLNS
jgi:hypothetical protein